MPASILLFLSIVVLVGSIAFWTSARTNCWGHLIFGFISSICFFGIYLFITFSISETRYLVDSPVPIYPVGPVQVVTYRDTYGKSRLININEHTGRRWEGDSIHLKVTSTGPYGSFNFLISDSSIITIEEVSDEK